MYIIFIPFPPLLLSLLYSLILLKCIGIAMPFGHVHKPMHGIPGSLSFDDKRSPPLAFKIIPTIHSKILSDLSHFVV